MVKGGVIGRVWNFHDELSEKLRERPKEYG
jgi:hypothetical protein